MWLSREGHKGKRFGSESESREYDQEPLGEYVGV